MADLTLFPEFTDWSVLPISTVELSQEQIAQAGQMIQPLMDTTYLWQAYLESLAWLGFQEWLAERAPDLMVERPLFPYLQVRGFRIYTLAIGSLDDQSTPIAKDVMESFNDSTDIFVLVYVLEELAQVQVSGYLTSTLLAEKQRNTRLSLTDGNYLIPWEAFVFDPDQLLWQLRTSQRSSQPAFVSSNTSTATQPAINVGLWLRDRLDEVAQQLAWALLPMLTPETSAFRSASRTLSPIIAKLAAQGMVIPPEARGAYQDFSLDNVALRLYAIVWAFPTEQPSRWRLLLILVAQLNTALPTGIRLQVQDALQVLSDQIVQGNNPNQCLYILVEGNLSESFKVSIFSSDGLSITLPSFIFHPLQDD